MIHRSHVTFRTIDAAVQDLKTGEDRKTMDVVEINYPDGKVVAFPVDQVSPEEGRKYSEIYASKYESFKKGEPDADKVSSLEREIAEKQAELKALKVSPKDDKRVQENLGYGVADQHEPFDHMTKAEIADWIAKNGETAPSDANKDDLVNQAKKIERKQKKAAA